MCISFVLNNNLQTINVVTEHYLLTNPVFLKQIDVTVTVDVTVPPHVSRRYYIIVKHMFPLQCFLLAVPSFPRNVVINTIMVKAARFR